jgi:hypothetical protein
LPPANTIEPSRENITPKMNGHHPCALSGHYKICSRETTDYSYQQKKSGQYQHHPELSAQGISLKQSLILRYTLFVMVRLLNLKGDGAMHQRVAFIDNQFCSSLQEKENTNNALIYVQRYRN